MKIGSKAALSVLALAVLLGAYLAWRYAETHPSTDDAYPGANVVRVGAQVTAPVSVVHVQ